MYGEEDETESVTDQPTTSRRAPTAGEPLPKKKREAFEVRVAASQLESLAECPERRVGHAPYALYRDGVLVRCRFCRAEGTHATDSCPVYPQTEDRRILVERCGYCLKCLGHCPREECRQPLESCYYCGGEFHNTALCTLPEERKHYEEVLMRAPARH
ncbi:unnamed protein product [Heligmosomoides polygyrus]|uniref:CCHC-type domain-containing protein n=1 Tax=Heligmosomoides polygyrus TaxID=6339 RepID=A0A183FF95_HELPZ|nr:unnamed protein product [Heligmosomoides polygyrus]